jgi:erythritol transport system ATP-binding protein
MQAIEPDLAPDDARTPDFVLEVEAITKVFDGTTALDDVDFRVLRGKVTALIGENGAGKSTLMKILAGAEQPTRGRIILEGKEVTFDSPREAADAGIGIIYQELSLFPNLSITDNIFAGRELSHRGRVASRAEHEHARSILRQLQVDLDPRTRVGDLRVAYQQIVEIAQALSRNARILIMDEPTSALGLAEVDVLFGIIRDLTARGVSVIYISHKLDEVLAIADHMSVLRDGRMVAESQAAGIDADWIIGQMLGRDLKSQFPKDSRPSEEILLRVENLTAEDPAAGAGFVIEDISLSLRKGEILGIYGLRGAGCTALLECLIGRIAATGGDVWLAGRQLRGDINSRIRNGLAFVPEDRQRDGLVSTMSVGKNMSLSSLRKYVRRSRVSPDAEKAAFGKMVRELSIRTTGANQPITDLSGGNQQKVVVGRALLTSPKVLLLAEPTRGIDVGAKAEIFALMNALANDGYGVLFASSEIDEVIAMSDRILVMSRGRVTQEFNRKDATEEKVMRAATLGILDAEEWPPDQIGLV